MLDFVDANGAAGGVSPVLKTRYLHGPAVDQILAQEELNGSGNSAVARPRIAGKVTLECNANLVVVHEGADVDSRT